MGTQVIGCHSNGESMFGDVLGLGWRKKEAMSGHPGFLTNLLKGCSGVSVTALVNSRGLRN